jgi:hypothetical protein
MVSTASRAVEHDLRGKDCGRRPRMPLWLTRQTVSTKQVSEL